MNLRRFRAFTLLELQIALLLMVLLFVTLFSVLRLARNSWVTAERRGSALDEQRGASELLRGLLLRSIPVAVAAGGKAPHWLLRGDADCLQFVAPLPAHRGSTGLYYLTLGWVKEDVTGTLRMHYRPLDTELAGSAIQDAGGNSEGAVITIMEKVTGHFAYQGTTRDGATEQVQGGWETDWATSTTSPPRLLRVRLLRHQENDSPTDWILPLYNRPLPGAPRPPLAISPQRLQELGRAPDCARLERL